MERNRRSRDVSRAHRAPSARLRAGLLASVVVVTLAAVGCSASGGKGNVPGGAGKSGGPAAAGSRSGVSGGALFGGDIPLAHETGALHRNLAIVRVYDRMGQRFLTRHVERLLTRGSTLLVSLDSVRGRDELSYASIADGRHDTYIRGFLEQMEQAAVRYRISAIYFCFEHEANSPWHRALGSPSEFVAAWDHMHQLAQSAHLDWNQGGRLHWVLILTHLAYFSQSQRASWAQKEGEAGSFWPGSNEVDIVAADGYNTGGCSLTAASVFVDGNSRVDSPGSLFNPVIEFAKAHGGLPVFIAEWASVPYAHWDGQAAFINMMRDYVAANREIAGALYWDSGAGLRCDYSINQYPASLSALAAMGRSPALGGHLVLAR